MDGTALLVLDRDGQLVSQGTTPVTDDVMSALIDAGRLRAGWTVDDLARALDRKSDGTR